MAYKSNFRNSNFTFSLIAQLVKNPTCNAGDPSSIPGLGISHREGIGHPLQCSGAFPVAQLVKNPPCNAGDLGSIPSLGTAPGEGKGYPLQCSGLENSTDCIDHAGHKERTQLSHFHFHFNFTLKKNFKVVFFFTKKRHHNL